MIWLYGLILWVVWRVLRDFALIEEKKIIDDLERGKCEMKMVSCFGKMKDGDVIGIAKLSDFTKTTSCDKAYSPLSTLTSDNSFTLKKGFYLEECHSCQDGSSDSGTVRLINERGKVLRTMDLKDEWAFYSTTSDVTVIPSSSPQANYITGLKRLRIEQNDQKLKGTFASELDADYLSSNPTSRSIFVGGQKGCKVDADYCTRIDLCGGVTKIGVVSEDILDPTWGMSQSEDCKTVESFVSNGLQGDQLALARIRSVTACSGGGSS